MSLIPNQGGFKRWGFVAVSSCCGLVKVGKWVKVYIVVNTNGELGTFRDQEAKEKVKKFDISNCEFFDAVKSMNRPCTIKVLTSSGSEEYISADNLKDIDDLKCVLEDYHGKFMGSDKVKAEFDSVLEQKPVKNWTQQDCCSWLRAIGVPGLVKKFEQDSITGQVLLAMDLTTFEQTMELPRELACNLYDEVREMQREGYFQKKKFTVRKKFRRFEGYKEEDFDPSPIVETLCDPSLIKHKFLTTAERYFMKELQKTIDENNNEENEKIQINKMNENGEGVGGEEVMIGDSDGTFARMEQFHRARLKIKLVVTEAVLTSKSTRLKKAVSPFVTSVGNNTNKFENFHTAIIVGPWYLEWTDSELIVPKRMVHGRAVITADVDTLFLKKDDLKEISDQIAEVVAKWNTKYRFRQEKGQSSNGRELSGNCQDFVDDILDAIGVKLKFEGALGDFIQKMRANGKADLEFIPCEAFRKYFETEKKGVFDPEELNKPIVFSTHLQLDEFCVKVSKNCFEISELFPSDWLLLKSFDRAFWMRHLQDTTDEKYKPLPPKQGLDLEEFPTGCPFKDPRETNSMGPF